MQQSASNAKNGTRVRLEHLEEDVRDIKKWQVEMQKSYTKDTKETAKSIAELSAKMNTFQLFQAAFAMILTAIATAWSNLR